ncbi:MAG: hypothetical protein FWB86_06085 [Treponema sp.]|nr:hypothetical protein [Treponema sp.]
MNINDNKPIIIYGAGNQGRAARNILESQGFCLTSFVDKNEAKVAAGEWEGAKIISINELKVLDKDTPVIIGIGAGRLDLLKEIDNMLTGIGFKNIFWSATEMIQDIYPNHEWGNIYCNHKLDVTTVVGCPITCRACPQDLFLNAYKKRSNEIIMSFNTFKTCINKLPAKMEISFAGFSEPFVNPECADFIIYAYNKGHKITLNTTLIGITDKTLEDLKSITFADIILHLPDKSRNSNIDVTSDYLDILKKFCKDHWWNVKDIKECRNFSVHGGDVDDTVKKVLLEAGINTDNVINRHQLLHRRGGNIKIDFAPLDQISTGNSKAIFCNYRTSSRYNFINNKDDERHIYDFKFFILLPNGDIVLCSRDMGLRHVLGNLLETDYTLLYTNNPEYDKIISARINNGDCICWNCELAEGTEKLTIIKRENQLN